MEKKRILRYDIIRTVAIFLVLMCHVSAFLVIQFPDTSTLEFQIGNIPNGICRACIPLFVMLSGALLLKEEKPFNVKTFYKKSLLWVGLLLVGWLAFYALFYSVILPSMTNQPIEFNNFIQYILTFKGSDYPHLWYMFMVFGLYLMLPIFRLFVKKENVKYVVGIVIAAIIYTFLMKTLNVFMVNSENHATLFTTFIGKFRLEGLGGYIAYFLLGWLFDNFDIKKPYRIVIYIVGLLALVLQIVTIQLVYNDIPTIRNYLSADLALPVILYGGAVFLFITNICKDKTHNSKILSLLSNCSFGVYMIHVFILEIFTRVWLTPDKLNIHPMLYFLLIYVIIIVLSYIITYFISKIKYVRKAIHIK